MGGSVAWTLRLDDGTEYRMDRWTNIIPFAITNMDFITGKPAHLEEVMKSWKEMADDWQRNRATGAYENDMTGVYAPYPYGLVPSGYGIIVTDFKTKKILSCQGYTSIGRCGYAAIAIRSRDEEFRAFAEAGRVLEARLFRDGKPTVVDVRGKSFDELIAWGETKGNEYADFLLDMSPFTIENFDEGFDGLLQLKARAAELGFVFSPEEEQKWAEWRAEEEAEQARDAEDDADDEVQVIDDDDNDDDDE